jgi:DNA polymerase elongation subunit (family B)
MSRVVFQAVDWAEQDCEPDAEDGEVAKDRVVVTVYGRCVDGKVVHAKLHSFKPTLLIKGGKRYSESVLTTAGVFDQDVARTKLRDLNGYHPEPCVFTVCKFDTAQAFCSARRKLKDVGIPLYNCRLQPFMQLVHKANVSPSGWISLPSSSNDEPVIEIEADWTDLAHVPGAEAPAPMAPFVVTSYDIECYSATGDFPSAIKGYNKLGREVVRYMESLKANGATDAFSWLESAVKRSLRGLEGELSPCVVAAGESQVDDDVLRHSLFGDLFDMMRQPKWETSTATDKIARVTAKLNSLTNRGFSESLKVAALAAGSAVARAYVSCMETGLGDETTTVIRGVHAGKDAAPWVPPTCIEDMAKSALKGAQTAHRNSQNADDLKEQISSKAERYAASEAQRCPLPWVTPPLPRLEGDPVIQIGLTTRTGNDPDMQKCVLVLGTCGDIEEVDVRTFDDEASLLKAFAAEIRRLDPDFVTGYNIMGFDFKYIRDRADELRIPDADMEMGRSDQERTSRNPMFVEKRLVSAAYGDNTLRFYDMPGRVVFDLMKVVQREHKLSSYKLDAVAQHFTGDKKDDLSPADIFRMHAQGPAERATVARYCVQDCLLVSDLVQKLNTLPNAIGMADVCLVPVSYIFLRGQGCKILSLVAKRCRLDGFALPELRRQEAEGYDGAFVLNPRIGVYLDTPVAVLDFNSLYPSSMIATNLSHDTMLTDDQPDPEGLEVEAVSFMLRDKAGNEREVTKRFVQAGPNDEYEGVLPRTLKILLNSRASVRKEMKSVSDPFQRAVMDGMQLAYKVTANSLYGQLGSATSDICCVEIAASTTAVGRSMLIQLKDFVENERQGDVIYGDTDSAFMTFPRAIEGLSGKDALAATIKAAIACSEEFLKLIKKPQHAAYEKTMFPFILISKKRYLGLLYEEDPDAKPKQKFMGVVLSRRDNAPIVKTVYSGVIDRLLNGADVAGAVAFVKQAMAELVAGKVPMSELIVSKNLGGEYADPDRIAHAVLARRMDERDPGSAPAVGDRVPYVYIVPPGGHVKGTLQGDRIEHPAHLNGAQLDYEHYIIGQVMKPVSQLFALMVHDIPGCKLTREFMEGQHIVHLNDCDGDEDKARRKDDALKMREVQRLIFEDSLKECERLRLGVKDISSYF